MTSKVKITEKIGFDNMSISAKLPSGASIRFSIGRSGERLTLAFSNDDAVLKEQTRKMSKWLELRKDENNLQRFVRLRSVLEGAKNSLEVMEKLETA